MAKLVYELAFPEGTSKKDIVHQEALALDALVAAGKIKEEDRENVTFIVNIIAESPHRRANVDYMESAWTQSRLISTYTIHPSSRLVICSVPSGREKLVPWDGGVFLVAADVISEDDYKNVTFIVSISVAPRFDETVLSFPETCWTDLTFGAGRTREINGEAT